tara:strand:+ start:14 stop:223 length:210 start_codon:yes stop_codon:yes gene_type:complete
MRAYTHCAEIIGKLRHRKTPLNVDDDTKGTMGFKTAFYEYMDVNNNEAGVGSQMNRVYSMCINIYRRLP